jgi:hypothetical protein
MMYRVFLGVGLAVSALSCGSAFAAELPEIKTSEKNAVPECVTPGRLTAYLRSKNPQLDPRFEKIAIDYMRAGEHLGVRWDYAFFQMAIETNYLSYKREGGRRGDVKLTQNNFAGLGAVGNGEPGESFKDVPTGVLAHLQHILVYAGEEVDDPVAERTRKVIQWGVLKSFQKKIKGPITYSHLAQKWATNSDYADAIETHANRFYTEFCKKPDPSPEMLVEARGDGRKQPIQVAATEPKAESPSERTSGAELARRAIEDGRTDADTKRAGLGGASLAKPQHEKDADATTPLSTIFTILNAPSKPDVPSKSDGVKPDVAKETARVETPKIDPKTAKTESAVDKPAALQNASVTSGMTKAIAPTAAGSKCRVWTASYGGQKAIIIKVQAERSVNYTVLDVNEGAEKREADAYIAAYAKGGEVAGEFTSQTQALDKAFELCPEG